jgi:hypothetical protein
LPKPREPTKGNIYIIFKDGEVLGWKNSGTAHQALVEVFQYPSTKILDPNTASRHRAMEWKFCKQSEQSIAIDEGEIIGLIVEGCDCQNSTDLRRRVRDQDEEIKSLKAQLNAFQKQRKSHVKRR